MIVDQLSMIDADSGISELDEFLLGQKLFALYRAGRGLFAPDGRCRKGLRLLMWPWPGSQVFARHGSLGDRRAGHGPCTSELDTTGQRSRARE